MDPNLSVWAVPLLIFASVALVAFSIATGMLDRRKVRGRYAGTAVISGDIAESAAPAGTGSRVNLDPRKLGLNASASKQLRAALVRAGYFSPNAVVTYTIIRTALVILLPLAAYLVVHLYLAHWGSVPKFALVAGTFIVAYYLGQGYLDRRQRSLEQQYRLFFPDFLDLLVVCVDAGLSLEAALERMGSELDSSNEPAFRTNLHLMLAEMRAGKSTIDALKAFSDRLGLSEASSLATLLQQSMELGTDVSASLATFSEEMRDKRMSRAEEKAFALPVKITIPLALFILPTIFIAILTPAVIRITTTLLK